MTAWTTTPITADLVRGALDLVRTDRGLLPQRLPARARAQVPDEQTAMAVAQPSGVRLVMRTAATQLELDVVRTTNSYPGVPPRPDGVYDALVDGVLVERATAPGGDVLEIDLATGARSLRRGPVGTVRFRHLPPGEKHLEVWLPHTEITTLVALRADAPVAPAPAEAEDAGGRRRPTWVHHGSSISHGSGADSPSTTWPALAAALGGVELVNLGFGGSALLDPFTARAVRDTPADLLSLKVGINVVNGDVMRRRAFGPALHGFLDTVREGHPEVPLVVVTALACPVHEDVPGPSAPVVTEDGVRFAATGDPADVAAGRLSLRATREVVGDVVRARQADDPHLHLLDGLELYGLDDAEEHPLPDALHPDAETHRLVGERFARWAFAPGAPFATR
ncbi:lipase [Streptomyces sp. NP160]|uniref:GDSL-type esterase/lipase family protein n=1 Tax=Streptomyces sp. NP160 TaxID=2586637 RepID=UPI00111A53F3|nr:GDSL-type esterase/lipase family protein [Streptomyces sp. NP160]TNM67159.1 lipase [Streptomyces sp. NP160]